MLRFSHELLHETRNVKPTVVDVPCSAAVRAQHMESSSRAGESLIFMFFQFQLSAGTFGSTWSVLGASWAQLGASWAPLGLNLGALRTNLAPTWALLRPTWRQLGRSWDQVGTHLSPHWAIMGDLVTLLVTLRRLWTLQGRSRLDFGAPKKDSGASEKRFRRIRAILESLVIVSGV